jgi:hypothetical protein
LNDFEFYFLAFFQGFEAFCLDCAVVYEYVISAFYLDEAVSFLRVEPFYDTLLHETNLPKHCAHEARKCTVNLFLQRSFLQYGKKSYPGEI